MSNCVCVCMCEERGGRHHPRFFIPNFNRVSKVPWVFLIMGEQEEEKEQKIV